MDSDETGRRKARGMNCFMMRSASCLGLSDVTLWR